MNKLFKPTITTQLFNCILKRNNNNNLNLFKNISFINSNNYNYNSNNSNNNINIHRSFTTNINPQSQQSTSISNQTETIIKPNETIEKPINNNNNEDDTSKYNISLTDECVKELNKIQSKSKDSFLRVMVDMGGCSGYQYIIKVENQMQDDDVLFTRDGARVIIDKISLEMMVGSVIDYETNLMRSSFCVSSNPNTIKSCGCKISFDLKK